MDLGWFPFCFVVGVAEVAQLFETLLAEVEEILPELYLPTGNVTDFR